MKIELYNTASRKIEEFSPISNNIVGIYTCGPTVYGRAHLGNMRAYIFSDILRRTLQLAGYNINHVMNITDVGHLTDDADDGDDKLVIGAQREHVTAWELASRYEKLFFNDCEKLRILRPTIVCRATDHIEQQIDMIRQLEEKGYTYITSDGVYFNTSMFPRYGELAQLNIEGLRAGERIEIGEKLHKTDFALWKFSPPGVVRDMEWESPWGKGFPGWHIECSAMSSFYLGKAFDIHTGGTDHIPIHHTNEIAQSESAFGAHPSVRYWLHCQFLIFQSGEKVSKSSGHNLSIDGLVSQNIDPLAYRYLCLTAHYRNFLNYTNVAAHSAAKALNRLRRLCKNLGYRPGKDLLKMEERDKERTFKFFSDIFRVLFSDLNTPQALAGFWDVLKDEAIGRDEKLHLITMLDSVFGLDLHCWNDIEDSDIPEDVANLVLARTHARAERNWKLSDELREQIEKFGFVVHDLKDGTKLTEKE